MAFVPRRNPAIFRARAVAVAAWLTTAGALVAGDTAPAVDTPSERTQLPAQRSLPLAGEEVFFDGRLGVTIRVESTHPDNATTGPETPGQPGKNGHSRPGQKSSLTGGLQVQANNRGSQAGASVGYNTGSASVAANAGTGGGGLGVSLGRGAGGGTRAARGEAGGRHGESSRSHGDNPHVGGAAANPPAVLWISFTNRSAATLVVYIVDFQSGFGCSAVQPNRIELAPGASCEVDPLYSFLRGSPDNTGATLILRLGGKRETRTLPLHAPPAAG